ncbi:MAG TPA: hypothetical protein ENK05_12450 [Gammaproteobacteria bacterium]|nr:hypothetical protein [Gammaproteobacteria bacterium]
MEFYALANSNLDVAQLQRELAIARLPQLCASIDRVLADHGDHGEIYCLWGQFRVNREDIRDGVRFSLPACPNALAWTVALAREAGRSGVLVHCTINRRSHEKDFVDSIATFVEDWRHGIEALAG